MADNSVKVKSLLPESTQRVKTEASRVGFDAVRITSANPPGHDDAMSSWLQAEMHGTMGYLERRKELRAGTLASPNLLEGAQSVVVVAHSYNFPQETHQPLDGNQRGVIARYARGSDYHNIVWDKLKNLGVWLEAEFPSHRARGFCDSGPIRERELARRCGIGWQGKHTNLISLDLGNWFFLGALLTTLPLAFDEPTTDHCGICTRCITACPTGAIVAPQTLDARRCISYLTIELKGSIPIELRPLMGNRIFGCDDCLAACPWNEAACEGREMRLAARDWDAAFPDLLALLELLASEAAFRGKFAGTPLLRPGRAGLRRNVCIALGNVGDAKCLEPLSRAAETDESEMVREHALWAITQITLRQNKNE